MAGALSNFQTSVTPVFSQAVARAENDPTGKLGVRSIEEPVNPGQILINSINNNLSRWLSGRTPAPWIDERPEKFVDFMQRRWAPIGAENDPDNLNKNWAPNVRSILRQLLGEEKYKDWEKLNIVRKNTEGTNAG